MSKQLTTVLLLAFSVTAFAQTQVPNEFQSGTPARAAEVNANFDALEAAIDQNAIAIQNIPAGPAYKLNKRITDTNSTVTVPSDDVVLDYLYTPAQNSVSGDVGVYSVFVKVTLASTGAVEWRPGIYTFVNAVVAPTSQGLNLQHRVAVYPAGSGCVGDPVSVLTRWPDRYRNPWDSQAYDPQTGNLYRAREGDSGLTVNDSVDVLEYNHKPQFVNGNNIGCRTTVPFNDPEYNPNQELINGQPLLSVQVYATSNYHTYMYGGTDENGVAISYHLTIDPME